MYKLLIIYCNLAAVKSSLLDGFPGVLTDRDHCGRPVLVMFASNWDARRYRLADIFRALLLSLEKLIEEEETQVSSKNNPMIN